MGNLEQAMRDNMKIDISKPIGVDSMAKPFAKKFYNSKEWINCRASYISTVHGLCEHCLERGDHVPGYIVDHIIEITPSNINDVEITLNHSNLQFLCLPCHNTKTFGKDVEVIREGLIFNEEGNLIRIDAESVV